MSKQKTVLNEEQQGSPELDLIKRIERCQKVISGIPNNEVVQILFEDLGESKKRIDENWHLVTDSNKLQELRVTKLAIHTLLNMVENYEHDLQKAQEQLHVLKNSKYFVNKDFDNEGVE